MKKTPPPASQTNIDRIVHYADFGSPLNQIFLIDALVKVSQAVVAHQEEVRENMKAAPVNPEAWIECAKEALKQFQEYVK